MSPRSMMATSPDLIRNGLMSITGAAVSDIRKAVRRARTAQELRGALFAVAPLVVGSYSDGSSALALEWYEERRDEAAPDRPFSPSPIRLVTDDDVKAMVAENTIALRDATADTAAAATATSLQLVAGGIQKQVAAGFWDTITTNTSADPSAVGWQRYARAGACKFCVMIAGRGSVFTETTANFAAHKACHCVAGPSFDPDAPRATAMQYVASKRDRTAKERADLRAYLNTNYPDAPG
jgi:hypothetical protein